MFFVNGMNMNWIPTSPFVCEEYFWFHSYRQCNSLSCSSLKQWLSRHDWQMIGMNGCECVVDAKIQTWDMGSSSLSGDSANRSRTRAAQNLVNFSISTLLLSWPASQPGCLKGINQLEANKSNSIHSQASTFHSIGASHSFQAQARLRLRIYSTCPSLSSQLSSYILILIPLL